MNKIIVLTIGIIVYSLSLIAVEDITQLEKQLKQDPDNVAILDELGRYYHDLAGNNILQGKSEIKDAVKRSEKYLSHLLVLNPTHSVAMVYYGSLYTIKAKIAFFPWTKLKYMNKGFALMDKAVYLDPENLHVRLIRGINSVNVPKSFHRLDISLEDFDYIFQHVVQDSMSDKFLLPFYYNYGLALMKSDRLNKAKEMWYKTIRIDSTSSYAKRAKGKLRNVNSLPNQQETN